MHVLDGIDVVNITGMERFFMMGKDFSFYFFPRVFARYEAISLA
ncbi:hypothetical protein [Mucilaginibacter rigui]|nr:hypothetical protein [Mucilaginibacter rigui]